MERIAKQLATHIAPPHQTKTHRWLYTTHKSLLLGNYIERRCWTTTEKHSSLHHRQTNTAHNRSVSLSAVSYTRLCKHTRSSRTHKSETTRLYNSPIYSVLYKTKEREREREREYINGRYISARFSIYCWCWFTHAYPVEYSTVDVYIYFLSRIWLVAHYFDMKEIRETMDGWMENNNKTGRQIGINAWPIANIFNKSNDFFLLFDKKNNREYSSKKEKIKVLCIYYIAVIIIHHTKLLHADCKFVSLLLLLKDRATIGTRFISSLFVSI